jgi:hypothetical protein
MGTNNKFFGEYEGTDVAILSEVKNELNIAEPTDEWVERVANQLDLKEGKDYYVLTNSCGDTEYLLVRRWLDYFIDFSYVLGFARAGNDSCNVEPC